MPKTILMLAEKGGVGKTTLYDELCWSLERTHTPYASYDLDQQGGTAHPTHADKAVRAVVVDTPGNVRDDWPSLIAVADLVCVPTRPTGRDLPSFRRTLDAVHANARPGTKILVVVNACNRFRMATQALDALSRMPKGSYDRVETLSQSEAIAQAATWGKSVFDVNRRSAGARDMARVIAAARELAGLPKEDLQALLS